MNCRHFMILLLISGIISAASAQNQSYKKSPSLGVSLILNDVKGASSIRSEGLSGSIESGNFYKISNMRPGLAITYMDGLSDHVGFMATLEGSALSYPIKNQPTFNRNTFLLETTAGLNLKLLSDKYRFTPYLNLSAGLSKYKKYYAAMLPVGAGFQLNISREAFIVLTSQYRIPVTENASYHFTNSIGVVANLVPRKPKEMPVPVPIVTDRDNDRIVDSLDACPDSAGLAALHGCPDKDGDGIPDKDDKCIDVPGLEKYQGCPIPDTDRDGINDEEDKCPNTPGVARYQGCPVPDTDNDAVNDEEDKCPNEAGPATNHGCPVIDVVIVEKINKAAQNIFFATASARLLKKSFKSLNDVVEIMKDNPSYYIDVDGHTDNTGSDELNQKLSESRANSVKQYLVDNGVEDSRIVATGYGETKPIEDNATVAGRAKNRRVEMHLRNY